MKRKNIGKMALIMALSTSLLALNPIDIYAQDENVSNEKEQSQKGNMTEAEAKTDYEKAKSQLETSEKNYQDSKEDQQNNDKAIEKLEDEIKDKNNKIETSSEQMKDSLRKQKDEEEEKIKLGEEEKENLEKDSKKKDEEIARNNEKIEKTKAQKENAEKNLEDEKANNPTYLEEFNKAENEVNSAKEKEAQAKKNLDAKKDLLDANEKAIDEKESARKKETDKLNEKEAEIKGLDKELADNNKLLQEKKEALKGFDPESDAYKKLSEEIKNLQAQAKLNEEKIKKLNDEKAKLVETINQQKDDLNKLDEANKDSDKIKTLEGQKDEKSQEKTSLEEENKALDGEIARLNKDIEAQEKEKTNKQTEIDGLKEKNNQINTEISELKANIPTKEFSIKEKEAKLAELKAKNDVEKIKAEAQKQWDKGSVGFFEKNGSKDALDVFTKEVPYDKFHGTGKNSALYLEANKEMTADDSRSLERMKESIDAIVEVNKIRQEKKGIDGRNLSIVGISDFEMAVAQANANYSQGYMGHASQYNPPFENLSWGTNNTARKALEGWYSEKELFDELRKMGYKSRSKMEEALKEAEVREKLKSKERMVGHYTNLVDDLMWPKDFTHKDSTVAGYAIRPSGLFKDRTSTPAQVHSLVLNARVGQEEHSKIYSVDEYRNKFNAYCKDLQDKIDGKVSITDEEKKAIDNLEKEVKTLKTGLETLKNDLASKEKYLKDTEAAIKAKENELSTLDQAIGQNKDKINEDKQKKEKNTKKIGELSEAIKGLENEIENIRSSNSDYNSKPEEIGKAIKENESELEEKNKSLADLKESQSTLEKDLEYKKTKLRAEDEKRVRLNEEIKSLEASIKEKTESLNKDKDQKKGLEENIKQIEDDKKALEDEKTALASDLEKAKEDLAKKSEEKKAKEESLAKLKVTKEKTTNLEKEIEEKGQTLTDLENSNKALEDAKKLIEKEEKALDKEINEAKAKLESLKKIDLADEKSFKDNSELSELYKKKQNLEEVKDDQKRLEQLVAKNEELKAKLEEAKKVYEKDLESYNKAEAKLDEFRKNERDFSSIILPESKDKISDENYEELEDALFEINKDYLFNDIKKDEGKFYEKVVSYERKDDKSIEKIFDGLEYYNRESIGKLLVKADNHELSFIEAIFKNKLNSNKDLRLSIFKDDKYIENLFKDLFTTNIKGVEVVLSKDKRSYLRANFMINGKYYSLEGRNLSSEEFVKITSKIIENIKSKETDERKVSLRKLAIARDELSLNNQAIEKLLNEYPNIVKNSAEKLRAHLAKARKVIEKANFILMEK